MRIAESEQVFRNFLEDRRLRVEELTPATLTASALEFYRTVRASDCEPANSDALGDGLLYQWGYFQIPPGIDMPQKDFTFDITRQFTEIGEIDDDALWQLSVTLYFSPTEEMKRVPLGNVWCWSPDDVPSLETTISDSLAYPLCAPLRPSGIDFYLTKV
jgi:hypothetical protein